MKVLCIQKIGLIITTTLSVVVSLSDAFMINQPNNLLLLLSHKTKRRTSGIKKQQQSRLFSAMPISSSSSNRAQEKSLSSSLLSTSKNNNRWNKLKSNERQQNSFTGGARKLNDKVIMNDMNHHYYNNKKKKKQKQRMKQRPDLFQLFDPLKNNDEGIHKLRTICLNHLDNERVLTSILTSWVHDSNNDDNDNDDITVGDRCYQVLKHLINNNNQKYCCKLEPNPFLYTCVINAYAKRKQSLKAEGVLRELLFMMDSSSKDKGNNKYKSSFDITRLYNLVMSSWVSSSPEQCERLLSEMKNYQHESSSNPLLHKLAPNTMSYTFLVHSYLKHDRLNDAINLLYEMISLSKNNNNNIKLDVFLLNNVMKVLSKKSNDPIECKQLLNNMNKKINTNNNNEYHRLLPNVVTYNILIDSYAKNKCPLEAEEVLKEMIFSNNNNIQPNIATFNTVMKAYARSKEEEDGPKQCERILSEMKKYFSIYSNNKNSNIDPYMISYSILIDAYARRGRALEAEQVLRRDIMMMSNKNSLPNVVAFTSVMKAWSKSNVTDAPEQCERLFHEMKKLYSEKETTTTGNNKKNMMIPNDMSYGVVLDAYAKHGRAKEAEKILKDMMSLNDDHIQPNVVLYNTVMKAWARSNATDGPEHCERLLDEMSRSQLTGNNKKLTPDAISYSIVIDAYTRRARPIEAEKVLKKMMSLMGNNMRRRRPSDSATIIVSYTSIMKAWVKSSGAAVVDAPEQCERLFAEMKNELKSDITGTAVPNAMSFSVIIDAYAKCGRASEAEKVLRDLLNDVSETKANVVMFNTVMKAWARSDAVDAAEQCERLLSDMKEADLIPDAISYSIVMDAYAKHGRATEAERVLRDMFDNDDGVKPNVVSFNTIIKAWSRSDTVDAPEQCERLLTEMTVGNDEDVFVARPNRVSYAIVVGAYAKRGRPVEAERVLRTMLECKNAEEEQDDGVVDVALFNAVMKAWSISKAVDGPEQCERILVDMKKNHQVEPSVGTFASIMEAYECLGRTSDVGYANAKASLDDLVRDEAAPLGP